MAGHSTNGAAPLAVPPRLETLRGELDRVTTAYYVVFEALANAAKHARASGVHVHVAAAGDVIRLAFRDDGIGDAAPPRAPFRVSCRVATHPRDSRPGLGVHPAFVI